MATTTKLNVNGEKRSIEVDPDTPLLWVLRDSLGLTGTKFGCGIAQCGACTVHVDGEARRSCVTPVRAVERGDVTTIEGLGEGDELHPLQQVWLEEDVVQCGYCQIGQLMSAAALLAANPSPSDDEIRIAMAGNICRCGAYDRIHKAIRIAAARMGGDA